MKRIIFLLLLIPSFLFGSSSLFDVIDDQVKSDDVGFPYGANKRTVMFWMQRISTGDVSGERFFYFYGSDQAVGYAFSLKIADASSNIWFQGAGADYTWDTLIDIPDKQWHHLAVTFNGTTTRTYKDGLLTRTSVQALTTTDVEYGFTLGAYRGDLGYWMPAIFYDFVIYNRCLSDDEIKFSMTKNIIPDKNTVSYWLFDTGYNDKTTYDLSGNNNNNAKHTGTSDGNSNPPILMQLIYAGD